jgi:hypothetical protein
MSSIYNPHDMLPCICQRNKEEDDIKLPRIVSGIYSTYHLSCPCCARTSNGHVDLNISIREWNAKNCIKHKWQENKAKGYTDCTVCRIKKK